MSALAGLVLAGAGAWAQPSSTTGTEEEFLRRAAVTEIESIDTGITLPRRVLLEADGTRRRAVFKSFEIFLSGQVVDVGVERQRGLRDSWKFEVAAYELDKLLGLRMVPVTVVRRIGNEEGALIEWVDGVLPEFDTSPAGFSMEKWQDEVDRVWLFDYLAYNIDRTPDNLLVIEGFQVRLIDHSRAFQHFLVPMRPLSRFPRAAIENLRRLRDEDVREALGPYLTGEEMGALLERRRRVLERVDRLLLRSPEAEVLFE
jgi:hypothetical protein